MVEPIICPLWVSNDDRFRSRHYRAWDRPCAVCGRQVRLGSLWMSCSILDTTASNPLTNEKHSPSRMKARGLSATSISRSKGSGYGLELRLIGLHLSLPRRSI
jgi:hypothetical protein